jgi:hypothetical protein
MGRILRLVAQIPFAHRVHGGLRIRRVAEISLHLGPDVEPLRIGNRQIDVVTTGIHCRQHGKQRLVRVQRDPIIVRRAQRRQQPEYGRHRHTSKTSSKPSSKSATQETTQESLPQDGHQISGELTSV